jgi:hypothetical protein
VAGYDDNVFINCPFDVRYRRMFRAIVFTVHDTGFVARCALEVSDAAENRLTKIMNIIDDCRYGIHDISRVELDRVTRLPRFNMPLEAGIFLGAKRFGSERQKRKSSLILDREQFRYRKFVSDLAGQDIVAHHNDPHQAIRRVRDWLRTESRRKTIPGPSAIASRFDAFIRRLPVMCRRVPIKISELTFIDYSNLVDEWLRDNAP